MGLLTTTLTYLSQHIPSILFTILIIHLARNYFKPGLSRIPGPFFAKITNLWRFVDVARGRAEVTHYQLHQKHGEYVRLGPNVVSVWNVEALKVIYGITRGYKKVLSLFSYLRKPRQYVICLFYHANEVHVYIDRILSCPATTCKGKADQNAVYDP